jgi:hypothetical protein
MARVVAAAFRNRCGVSLIPRAALVRKAMAAERRFVLSGHPSAEIHKCDPASIRERRLRRASYLTDLCQIMRELVQKEVRPRHFDRHMGLVSVAGMAISQESPALTRVRPSSSEATFLKRSGCSDRNAISSPSR